MVSIIIYNESKWIKEFIQKVGKGAFTAAFRILLVGAQNHVKQSSVELTIINKVLLSVFCIRYNIN
jgi:hypothetical protein